MKKEGEKNRRRQMAELFSCWFEGSIVFLFTLLLFYSYLISGSRIGVEGEQAHRGNDNKLYQLRVFLQYAV